LPEGADRAAAEAFLRSLEAPPPPPPATVLQPVGSGPWPRLIALVVILVIVAYTLAKMRLPAL
jgi:hypothetical protein